MEHYSSSFQIDQGRICILLPFTQTNEVVADATAWDETADVI